MSRPKNYELISDSKNATCVEKRLLQHYQTVSSIAIYSEIPLLRPPKIETFSGLKTLFAKFKLFISSFSTPSVCLIRDHLWDCPKVVFKTTFGQSQRWS